MAEKNLKSMREAVILVEKARKAQAYMEDIEQGLIDTVVKAISIESVRHAERLAKLAVKETGFGKWKDKKAKNLLASETLYSHICDKKTIGIINEDKQNKIVEIATPVGVIAALIPSTNPTSTTIYKSLISIKAGNAIVFSPHPSAIQCIRETVEMIRSVLSANGLQEDLVCIMENPSIEGTCQLMKESDLILATGGPQMVKAAYSSGTPALTGGSGNVPVYIEQTADIKDAIGKILESKTFDNGTICASEQAIVTEQAIAEEVKQELVTQGGYFLTGEKLEKVKAIMERPNGGMNPQIVGKDAQFIADLAGIEIPEGTILLVCEEEGVGEEYKFSKEKLTALMAFYSVKNSQEAFDICADLLKNGGIGHTMAIHSKNDLIIKQFSMKNQVSRMVINAPSTHGAVGLSTNLPPSFTLGCGSIGGTSTSDSVGPEHLYNIRRIAYCA